MYVKISLMKDNKEVLSFVIPKDVNPLIGRESATNDIIIHDPKVSRVHARLFRENDHVFVQDFNSRFGTFVNGVKVVDKQLLGDQSLIKMGNTYIKVIVEDWVYEQDEEKTISFQFCRNPDCHKQFKYGFKFCPHCGTHIK